MPFFFAAIAASSGLAAQSNIMQILNSGDHIVSTGDLYGGMYSFLHVLNAVNLRYYCLTDSLSTSGTHRQFRLVVSKFGITSSYIDATDLSQVEAAIKDNTKVRQNFLCMEILASSSIVVWETLVFSCD